MPIDILAPSRNRTTLPPPTDAPPVAEPPVAAPPIALVDRADWKRIADRPAQPPADQAKRVLCIVGTRPEIIKMAPVIHALQATPGMSVSVLSSGQHRELLTSV